MVAMGLFFIGLFAVAFYLASMRRLQSSRIFLVVALCALPLPWIAGELGWYVAEVGRQPWVIEGVLPTFLAVSSLSAGNVLTTLVGFIAFYSALLVIDIYLMAKARIDGLAASNDCRPRTAERTGDYMFGAHRDFGLAARTVRRSAFAGDQGGPD